MSNDLPTLQDKRRTIWKLTKILRGREAILADKKKKGRRWYPKKADGTADKERLNEDVVRIGRSNKLLGKPLNPKINPISHPELFKKI